MISALDVFHVVAFWRSRRFGEIRDGAEGTAERSARTDLTVDKRGEQVANREEEQFDRGDHLVLRPSAGPKASIRIGSFEREAGGFQFLFFRK